MQNNCWGDRASCKRTAQRPIFLETKKSLLRSAATSEDRCLNLTRGGEKMRESTYSTETADTQTCQSWGPIGCVGSDGAEPTNATTMNLGVFTTHSTRKRVRYSVQVSSVSSLRPEASGRRELELPVVVHTDQAFTNTCTWIKGRRLCHF